MCRHSDFLLIDSKVLRNKDHAFLTYLGSLSA